MGLPLTTQPLRLTPEEYFSAESRATDRSEYRFGRLTMMAGGTYRHSRICHNVNVAVGFRLRGHPCQASESNTRVAVLRGHYYVYPDLTVVCGEPKFDPADKFQTTLTNPTLVIEVLSESTEAYDRGDKFNRYRDLESLREVVLVSSKQPSVLAFLRQNDGTWSMLPAEGLSATIRLRSLATPTSHLEIPLAEIYEKVDFTLKQDTDPNAPPPPAPLPHAPSPDAP